MSGFLGNILTRSFGFGELARGMAPNYAILAYSYYHMLKDTTDRYLNVFLLVSIFTQVLIAGVGARQWGMTPLYCMNIGFMLKKYSDSGAKERFNDYLFSVILLLMFAFITEEAMKGLAPDVAPFFIFMLRCSVFIMLGGLFRYINPAKLPF